MKEPSVNLIKFATSIAVLALPSFGATIDWNISAAGATAQGITVSLAGASGTSTINPAYDMQGYIAAASSPAFAVSISGTPTEAFSMVIFDQYVTLTVHNNGVTDIYNDVFNWISGADSRSGIWAPIAYLNERSSHRFRGASGWLQVYREVTSRYGSVPMGQSVSAWYTARFETLDPSSIPEPGTFALGGLALAALGLVRKRLRGAALNRAAER